MTAHSREETITLVAKNPAMVALFLSRALGEGYVAFEKGSISAVELLLAFVATGELITAFLEGRAHELKPYRTFVAELMDRGAIEVSGELGRISDPAGPQSPRTVN